MTHLPPQLDRQQGDLEKTFTRLAQQHPQELALLYLQLNGTTLSTRLAAELSENFRHSNLTRGYYRNAVTPGAQLILNKAWQIILKRHSINKPLLLIAGGGPGSGKLTAINHPLLALTKETLAIYDTSDQSTRALQQIINQAHTLNIPVILAYITRPLPYAAQATIDRDLDEGLTPCPKTFATSHFENYDSFQSLTKYYSKAKKLFASIVITNVGPPDLIQTTKPSYLKQFEFTITNAEEIFAAVLNETLNSLPSNFPNPQPISLKPRRKPRTAKTLPGQSTLIGYLLAQSLRTALISNEQKEKTESHAQVLKDSATGPQPPTQTLVHVNLENDPTQTDPERILQNERPLRTVVQETTTHNHEMETVLIR
jgi:hypothetical protein